MTHSLIIGSGSSIPTRCITNDMLATVMETSDTWIRERTGVETRYFVDPGTSTLDLSIPAARQALEAAAIQPGDIDVVVYATMTPDHYMPGNGGLLQARLGLRNIPCFDIRQQCCGFLYALQLADAQIRSGLAKTVLVVGAEVHSIFMTFGAGSWARLSGVLDAPVPQEEWDLTTRNRHLVVLFGDGAAAVVVQGQPTGNRGIIDHIICADGTDYDRLCVPGVGSAHRPYVDTDMISRGDHYPMMDGRYIFKQATGRMAEVAQAILKRNGLTPADLSLVLMHQANRRINEYVQKVLGLPDSKVIHNIQKYGNTTAATIPLLWDEGVRTGRITPGGLVLCVAFGAGVNWGATLIRA
ncbi:MAG: 3-oxoacyl-ACP synthase [Acidobacteria bacterium]|nr:3-oxoacyl-ACP synthase [Acidobacteriota bacterium]